MTLWYENLGFERDPFFLNPIGESEEEQKGFINRDDEKESIKRFTERKVGSMIVISDIGLGKSSLLSIASGYGREIGKFVININGSRYPNRAEFNRKLIEELKNIVPIEINLDDISNLRTGDAEIIIISDDLDKLDEFHFVKFMDEVISPLSDILFLTTAQRIHLSDIKIASKLNKTCDYPLLIDPIDSVEKLREFVDGRIGAYSKGKPKIKIEDNIMEIILDRTQGNLRETFRILSKLIEGEITKSNLVKTIKALDKWKIQSLDEINKKILDVLLTKGELEAKEIVKYLKELKDERAVKNRLDDLVQLGIAFKFVGKVRGRGRKTTYKVPSILRDVI